MNWLLVDAGNTAVKWTIASGTIASGPISTGTIATATSAGTTSADTGPAASVHLAGEVHRLDNVALDFDTRLATLLTATPPFEAALGCCVASDAVRASIGRAVAQRGGVTLTWLFSQAAHPVAPALVNRYRDPAQLGADRWHAMLGARSLHPARALVVVHAGTATTIDCVSADGAFVGGAILPGAELMREALARRTARLPHARGAAVAFPDNTDDAIITGIADAQAGAVERIAARFARQQGAAVTVLLGGGAAAALHGRLQAAGAIAQVELAHNLVLRGLWRRAREIAR